MMHCHRFIVPLFCAFITAVDASIVPQRHTGVQSYRVIGTFLCGEEPAVGVRVKLIDDDFGTDADDELDASYTDEKGHFDLAGDNNEMTTIDAHLKVYHDCNDHGVDCQRRWKFELPNHYITGSRTPQKTLDIGVWNLEAKLPDESHDCIH